MRARTEAIICSETLKAVAETSPYPTEVIVMIAK